MVGVCDTSHIIYYSNKNRFFQDQVINKRHAYILHSKSNFIFYVNCIIFHKNYAYFVQNLISLNDFYQQGIIIRTVNLKN